MLKSLHEEYFQKSKIFLYPAIMIPRGTSVTPICTYTSWEGHYKHEDCKLMCLYHLRDDAEFKQFEKNRLFNNMLFDQFYELDGKKGMYVFDFSSYKEDWQYFLDGKYSKFSLNLKSSINIYYMNSKKNYVYVDSYINPEMYFEIYSELLECDVKILEKVGELCDKPNLDKETSHIKVKELNISGFDITSP